MEARLLDALVAEKIFGWENNFNGPTFLGERGNQIYADTGDWKVIDCPCYSTDIEDAWLIAIKLTSEGKDFEFNGSEYLGTSWWTARFDYTYLSRNLSPARAICLAALRSVGIEV
jgi:hypothetical protein